MTPLPPSLVPGCGLPQPPLIAWRLDQRKYQASWDSGEGARLYGGRWNSIGRRVVYCSIDPATAILEVAVHKTFRTLDTVPHVITSLEIIDPSQVHVVQPNAIPNSSWLSPGLPSAGQQGYGDQLLASHGFVAIPSVVSKHSWNLLFDRDIARGQYRMIAQADFALDTRLHPSATP
ncbi:MAG TPA: RES domain-containing protein [Dongiaceae bacterium]|nr:RES domain-containing protein [Dongiaceae bacterium]